MIITIHPERITEIHMSCLAADTAGVIVMTMVMPKLIRVIIQNSCKPVIFMTIYLDLT
ncbi:hypothetical protein D3C74_266360 [compost metagenome]